MSEIKTPAIALPAPTANAGDPAPVKAEGDFATGERTEPKVVDPERHEGDFAAGERTEAEAPDAEAELHGDFAAGERTEPVPDAGTDQGTFADTTDG